MQKTPLISGIRIRGLDSKVLVDTSAWIEFFRKKEPYHGIISGLIDDDRICCTGLIVAELIQGAKSDKEIAVLKEFLHVFDFIRGDVMLWEKAGELSYAMRSKGKPAGLADCYIAAAASANKSYILTLDRDFENIKSAAGFKLYPVK